MEESKFKLKGNVSLYAGDFTFEEFEKFTEEQKKKYLVDKGDNLVVDTGLTQILLLMIGSNTSSFTLCGVGSGTNTPVNTDTTLQTSIGSNTINSRYLIGTTAYFNTFFNKNDKNGTWNETGLINASSVMLCRRVFPSPFTKDTSNAAVISWSISISAVAD